MLRHYRGLGWVVVLVFRGRLRLHAFVGPDCGGAAGASPRLSCPPLATHASAASRRRLANSNSWQRGCSWRIRRSTFLYCVVFTGMELMPTSTAKAFSFDTACRRPIMREAFLSFRARATAFAVCFLRGAAPPPFACAGDLLRRLGAWLPPLALALGGIAAQTVVRRVAWKATNFGPRLERAEERSTR